MQFHIDIDTADDVAGWLAPTRPDQVPVILVGARNPVALAANVLRPDLAALGTHASGQVGFHVSRSTVPGLASMEDLELRDGETGLLIYRRRRAADLPFKLMRFTQGYGVQTALDEVLSRRATLSYTNCGEYPFATLYGLFNNRACDSVFAAGALSYDRHHAFARERGFLTAMLLKNPFSAMAETLLALQAAIGAGGDSTQYLHTFAAWFVNGGRLHDPEWLARMFLEMSADQRLLLANPAVRILACRDEPVEHRHVAIALEKLAMLDLAGVESALPVFRQSLIECVGTDLLEDFSPQQDAKVQALTERLLSVERSVEMLALDMTLHDLVVGAVAASA